MTDKKEKKTPAKKAPPKKAAVKKAPAKKTTTPPRKKKPNPTVVQRRASDPNYSVWVTASAGTGKTKVLTDRVLRLLLQGSKPEDILCVTFTNAGASVMKNRIRDFLSHWATCSDKVLESSLRQLVGKNPTIADKKRARQLFAEFLDTPGSIRIQTIHSFSQSLLRQFPIETGVPPYFDVMDEQTASEFLRSAQAEILNEIKDNPNTDLAKAVHLITPEVSEEDFVAMVAHITYRRGQLKSLIRDHGGLQKTIDAVYDYMGVTRGQTMPEVKEAMCSENGVTGVGAPDLTALQHACDLLFRGSSTDNDKAMILQEWVGFPSRRLELLDDYLSVFLTDKGEMRKRLCTQKCGEASHILEAEAKRLIQSQEIAHKTGICVATESLMVLSHALLDCYEKKKADLNMLDYDDLIYQANRLLSDRDDTSWVLEKLDGNIDHILVDEAQDTNPEQWEIIASLTREFFERNKRKKSGKNQTMFVVGDEKQSIFSFQRADPKEFYDRKKFFEKQVKSAGGKWRQVDMEIAFRSSPAIMSVVDAVFANDLAADGLRFDDKQDIKHDPFRKGHSGVVEMRPVTEMTDLKRQKAWDLPLKMEEVSDPSVDLAEQIADEIKDWMDSGEKLKSRGRAINPSDIMILVRRRSAFVDHMVRALKKRDVPVAGADRMALREQIAVMDLEALGEFILAPGDDYNLACLLKSPLIGLTDQQLEDLAMGRKGRLWDALQEKAADEQADPLYKSAHDYLLSLRQTLDMERPYEFYSHVLMSGCPQSEKSGLFALYSRLGYEAEDPIVEFMNAIERFEKCHTPSLQGFLAWLAAGQAEVKREMSVGKGGDAPKVNIMTVHGAKGLEAPVVILPDTTGVPSDNTRTRPKLLWPNGDRKVPLWVPRSEFEDSVFDTERTKIENLRDQEYRRLLYVAMTRAEDRLYVFGYQNKKNRSSECWYDLIKAGLAENMGKDLEITPDVDDPENVDKMTLRYTIRQTARVKGDGVEPAQTKRRVGVPLWARTLPKQPPSKMPVFRPSSDGLENAEIIKKQPAPANDNHDGGNGNAKTSEMKSEMKPDLKSEAKQDTQPEQKPSPLSREFANTVHQTLGNVTHELLEFLPNLPTGQRANVMADYLKNSKWKLNKTQQKEVVKNVTNVLQSDDLAFLFGENSRPEISITGVIEQDGQQRRLSGQIDRLVVEKDTVWIVDYKNGLKVPKTEDDLSPQYLVQMATYRHAIQAMYPDKQIKCAFLWTRATKLQEVSDKILDKTAKDIKLGQGPKKKPTRRPVRRTTPKKFG